MSPSRQSVSLQNGLKPCPFLPVADPEMSHRCLTELRGALVEDFYETALRYGNYLWQTGHSGRALLSITRALYADLPKGASVLQEWPLPYKALQWIVRNHTSDDFPGNPRISYAHQATRIRGERVDLRRSRAWATWYLIKQSRPSLMADAEAESEAPGAEQIAIQLKRLGQPKEADNWLCLVE